MGQRIEQELHRVGFGVSEPSRYLGIVQGLVKAKYALLHQL